MNNATSVAKILGLGLCVALSSCVGGGEGCTQTGPVEMVYSPAVAGTFGQALTYELGKPNTWTLQVRGVSSECLGGLNVTVVPDRPALPASVHLDPATGTLSTGVLAAPIEGYCNGSNDPSINRSCPAGTQFHDQLYVLLVTSDLVNKETKVPTVITFQPKP
jgi:hypothetical protein